MKQLVLALGLFGIALGANAALMLHVGKDAETLTGSSRVDLGGKHLVVPMALMRDRAQLAGGRLDRLDIAASSVDFSPLPQASAQTPDAAMPEQVSMVITSAGTAPDPTEMFQSVYVRFLARETWSNPGGLIMRRFRADTPYEDRELYIGAGGKKVFVALCPLDAQRGIEPCTTSFRQNGLDIEMRFEARRLPEWRRLTGSALALASGLLQPSETAGR